MTARYRASVVARPEPGRLPLPARALLGVAVVIAAVVPALFGASALTAVGGREFLTWMATWGTPIAYAACTAIVVIRLVCVRQDRAVWSCFAAAALLWTLANSYYAFFVAPAPAPLPSLQDAGYVLFPIALMLGLAQSARARGLRFGADLWLDGLVAGLGVAAASTAVVFTLVRASDDDLPSIVTTLVYPVLDDPDGLAGTAIPLGARIVAVCDSFDAMVSDRVYRRGMPAAEALAELRRCAGTQFDPAVVEAFAGIAGEALGLEMQAAPLQVVRTH